MLRKTFARLPKLKRPNQPHSLCKRVISFLAASNNVNVHLAKVAPIRDPWAKSALIRNAWARSALVRTHFSPKASFRTGLARASRLAHGFPGRYAPPRPWITEARGRLKNRAHRMSAILAQTSRMSSHLAHAGRMSLFFARDIRMDELIARVTRTGVFLAHINPRIHRNP